MLFAMRDTKYGSTRLYVSLRLAPVDGRSLRAQAELGR
jgi:hypothetical protein